MNVRDECRRRMLAALTAGALLDSGPDTLHRVVSDALTVAGSIRAAHPNHQGAAVVGCADAVAEYCDRHIKDKP